MIGKIERLNLRDLWKHEALDFTTWLEGNIEILSEIVGFPINDVQREKSTGNFNVDLIGSDRNGNNIIIENQLEKSDHDHLGKIITYLSSIGEKIVKKKIYQSLTPYINIKMTLSRILEMN
ncbi:MAG: hypothetical protein OEZ34_12445 [Spirochaetia bacterium]|nr:hypothetical protein [Spirochaetia bacterium]